MYRIFILALTLCSTTALMGQNASDVLRYSYLQPGGTARSLGAGGAFGALGAEFGAISQNPAGLALFRSNELVLTPSISFASTDAAIPDGTSYNDAKSKFGFDNIGMVFNTTPSGKHWKTFNFAIGYNRQADFNRVTYYEGNASGSIITGFFNDYRAGDSDPFGAGLAASSGAFYPDPDNNDETTYDFAGNEQAIVNRAQSLTTFGRMNEMTIAFAGNYDEKLMVGATVGVPFVNYRLEGEYIETDPSENVQFFDQLIYTEYLRSSGVGVNLKLGVIYKVSQALRLGAAFHTPTALSITYSYSNTFVYDFTDGNGPSRGEIQESPNGTFDYKLRTPWRASASAAVVMKKFGFFSADVEWVDYAANRFNFTSDIASQGNQLFERDINNDIQRNYRQTMNIRLGGELVLDNFRLRGGFNLLGKPQEGATDFNTAYTAGVGVRAQSFYLDLGWRLGRGTGSVQPYAGAPVAETKTATNDFLVTLGFKF